MVLTLYRDDTYWVLFRDEGPLLRVYNVGRIGRDIPGLPPYTPRPPGAGNRER